MAVYTHINEPDLKDFLQNYNLGSLLNFNGIAEGVENSNYLVNTTKGRFILTLYEKRVDIKDLPFFLSLMNHMADAGLPSPRPISDKNGETLRGLCGKTAALIEFMPGTSRDDPNPEECAMMGDIMARAHLSVHSFNLNRDNALSLEGWKTLSLNCVASIKTRQDETQKQKPLIHIQELIDEEINFLTRHWPKSPSKGEDHPTLPRGVIHADLFPDNVLLDKQGHVTGIIDFYFSCTDFFVYDLAVCLNAWCFDAQHGFVKEKWEAMAKAYERSRPLTDTERKALPIMARGAALRILLTRFYDWLNQIEGAVVNVKNPDEYVKKLTFHRDNPTALL